MKAKVRLKPLANLSEISEDLSGLIEPCAVEALFYQALGSENLLLTVHKGGRMQYTIAIRVVALRDSGKAPSTLIALPQNYKVATDPVLYANLTLYKLLAPKTDSEFTITRVDFDAKKPLNTVVVVLNDYEDAEKDLFPPLKYLELPHQGVRPVHDRQDWWLLLKNGQFKSCKLIIEQNFGGSSESGERCPAGVATSHTKWVYGHPELYNFHVVAPGPLLPVELSKLFDPLYCSLLQRSFDQPNGRTLLTAKFDSTDDRVVELVAQQLGKWVIKVDVPLLIGQQHDIEGYIDKLQALVALYGWSNCLILINDLYSLVLRVRGSRVAPVWIALARYLETTRAPVVGLWMANVLVPDAIGDVFQLKISLPTMSYEQRLHYLRYLVLSHNLINQSNGALEKVASYTKGSGPGMLDALLHAAVWDAQGKDLSMDHWEQALGKVAYSRTSSAVDFSREEGGLDYDRFPGCSAIKAAFLATARGRLGLQQNNVRFVSAGVLLHGQPGCGKTMLVKALARQFFPAPLLCLSPGELLQKYQGASELKLSQTFAQARQRMPSIVFFDEIDSMFDASRETRNLSVVLIQELKRIQIERLPILVVGATNLPEKVDPYLLVSGRIDCSLELALPCERDRREIIKFYLDRYRRDSANGYDLGSDVLVVETEGKSPAEISSIVASRCRDSLREHVLETTAL